jgi:glycosyltransferase involved in cell wall biosynthesis
MSPVSLLYQSSLAFQRELRTIQHQTSALQQQIDDMQQQVQATQKLIHTVDMRLQETLEKVQSLGQQMHDMLQFVSSLRRMKRFVYRCGAPVVWPLRWSRRLLKRVRCLGQRTLQHIRVGNERVARLCVITTLCGMALLRRRKPSQPRDRRILMLTVSQIEIDPRINKVARTLASGGYEVDIVCYANQSDMIAVGEEVIQPGVRYVRVPREDKWQGHFERWFQEEFYRVALQRPYDYVHANDLPTLLVGWILARARGVPLIYDTHEMWSENVVYNGHEWIPMPSWIRTLTRYYEGFLVRYVHLLVTVSPSIRAEFQQRYKVPRPPYMLANYPELRLVRQTQETHFSLRAMCGLTAQHFVTLYLGGVNPLRNIENVIKAHQYLPQECVFVIRGPGIASYRPHYEAFAKECGLEDRVFCLPPVPMDDVIAGAAGADCGIVMLRNLCKNFYWFYPNKFFEYMLAGLPVAVSNFPDVTAHVQKEECGVLFDPEVPQSIAEALRWLYEHPDARRAMGERARASIFREYNWEALTKPFLDLYRQV